VPQYLQVVDAIPKTASEKPQERFLVDALHAEPHRVHVER
jgi:crotonobetaine/carnitine-CoA ligase